MLRAQDVIVAIQLRTYALQVKDEVAWTYAGLSRHTGLSTSQGHAAVERLRAAGIVSSEANEPHSVRVKSLGLLLQHAVPIWIYPETMGAPGATRGVPTAWSAPPLMDIMGSQRGFVWPHPEGTVLGEPVSPLHHCVLKGPGVPGHERYNERLHQTLAVVDALRLGRPRGRREAMVILVDWGYAC